ncbi:MAG: DUF2231 domain-containing protein [Actinomycetota bacterium]
MDKLFGLPAHPLLVHIPVVLVPLAAIGALAMAFWPWLRARIGWIVAGLAVLGGVGALLAASAGESLQESRPENAAIRHHAELGDTAKLWSIIFAILVLAFVVGEWWLKRRTSRNTAHESAPMTWTKWAVPAVAVLTVASGAWATYSVMDAGHTGAKSTWQQKAESGDRSNYSPNGDAGYQGDDDD